MISTKTSDTTADKQGPGPQQQPSPRIPNASGQGKAQQNYHQYNQPPHHHNKNQKYDKQSYLPSNTRNHSSNNSLDAGGGGQSKRRNNSLNWNNSTKKRYNHHHPQQQQQNFAQSGSGNNVPGCGTSAASRSAAVECVAKDRAVPTKGSVEPQPIRSEDKTRPVVGVRSPPRENSLKPVVNSHETPALAENNGQVAPQTHEMNSQVLAAGIVSNAIPGQSSGHAPLHIDTGTPPPTVYPQELLKNIGDNMNAKDNANLWALLKTIAGPLIIKNVSPPPPPMGPGMAVGDFGPKDAAIRKDILQAMEQNFIQNNPGYEILANAIFSNGGLLPSYFTDPLMISPPGVVVSSNHNNQHNNHNRGRGNGYHSHRQRLHQGEGGHGGHHGTHHHATHGPFQPEYNPYDVFIYNGQIFHPRPKSFWNFCANCKSCQYCPLHHNNYNSSNAAAYQVSAGGHFHQGHFVVHNNHYNSGYVHNGGRGGYYQHPPNYYYQPNRSFNNGHRDKRNNGRKPFHKQQGNKQDTASNGSSTPSGSGPPSPQVDSPSPDIKVTITQPDQGTAPDQSKPRKTDKKGNHSKSQYGRKRWNNQRVPNGYDSDSSSSRSCGTDPSSYKYNYGLLENMSLWNTESNYKREQLLSGELGSHQLMSPTNHASAFGPLLLTVMESQGGHDCDGNTTQPVLQYESGEESLQWPVVGSGLANVVECAEEEGTPADKYLENSHLVELKETPKELIESPTAAVATGLARDNLSQQVWNTFMTVQQTQLTYRKKIMIWKMLFASIKKVFPHLRVYLVGSTITGFGAETSDVDMCVVSSAEPKFDARLEAVINLSELKKFLTVSDEFEEFQLIQAKVPILRFQDKSNKIEVDLNYNNCVGIRNTHLLYCYSQMDWRVRPLVMVIKLWAKYQDINNAKNMTISSYSLVLMVIHFLQCGVTPSVLPCLHTMYPEKFDAASDISSIDMNEELGEYKSENQHTLGELLLRFLYYYSTFDFNNLAISVRTGSCLLIDDCRYVRSPKNDPQQWKNLCIEEPFDFTNTARSVFEVSVFEKIKFVFVQSFHHLHQTLDLKSILSNKFMSFAMPNYFYVSGAHHHGRDSDSGENNNYSAAVSPPSKVRY